MSDGQAKKAKHGRKANYTPKNIISYMSKRQVTDTDKGMSLVAIQLAGVRKQQINGSMMVTSVANGNRVTAVITCPEFLRPEVEHFINSLHEKISG